MLSHFNVETTSEIQLNPNQSAHRDPIGRLVSFSTTNLSQLSSQEPVTRVEQSICMNYSPLESPTQPDSIRIQCGRAGGGGGERKLSITKPLEYLIRGALWRPVTVSLIINQKVALPSTPSGVNLAHLNLRFQRFKRCTGRKNVATPAFRLEEYATSHQLQIPSEYFLLL